MTKIMTCGCKPATTHRDCLYCGCGGPATHVCGVCHAAGIDGPVIRGTSARKCPAHRQYSPEQLVAAIRRAEKRATMLRFRVRLSKKRKMDPARHANALRKARKTLLALYAVSDSFRFPDTAQGARAALNAMASGQCRREFATAKHFPDPQVAGVWGADATDGQRAIIYLAGYKQPLGDVRERNDFETGEQPARSKS